MLIDFLNFHQRWDPSYIRRTMFPMMSTIFLRDMSTTPTGETLLFGQYEFDSVERVKMRYGYQFYVVKWKRAGVNINTSKVPSNESSAQQDVVELDEMVDLLDDAPEIHVDGCSFLFTDENMDLVGTAFPAEVKSFLQEQVFIILHHSSYNLCLFLLCHFNILCFHFFGSLLIFIN